MMISQHPSTYGYDFRLKMSEVFSTVSEINASVIQGSSLLDLHPTSSTQETRAVTPDVMIKFADDTYMPTT